MAAKRPEGVGATGLDLLRQKEVGAPREATPSVAFGDISPSRGEIISATGSATRGQIGRVSFL